MERKENDRKKSRWKTRGKIAKINLRTGRSTNILILVKDTAWGKCRLELYAFWTYMLLLTDIREKLGKKKRHKKTA